MIKDNNFVNMYLLLNECQECCERMKPRTPWENYVLSEEEEVLNTIVISDETYSIVGKPTTQELVFYFTLLGKKVARILFVSKSNYLIYTNLTDKNADEIWGQVTTRKHFFDAYKVVYDYLRDFSFVHKSKTIESKPQEKETQEESIPDSSDFQWIQLAKDNWAFCEKNTYVKVGTITSPSKSYPSNYLGQVFDGIILFQHCHSLEEAKQWVEEKVIDISKAIRDNKFNGNQVVEE